MTVFVVDTNVAIVANAGEDVHVDVECQLICAEQLQQLVDDGTIAVDKNGFILDEYADHLSWSGGPGMGDEFFMYVFNNQHQEDRVQKVVVNQIVDNKRGFEELPENTFDRSDRKFLAVAVVAEAVVLNATDSDWSEHQELMNQLNVEVQELCPQYLERRRGRRG